MRTLDAGHDRNGCIVNGDRLCAIADRHHAQIDRPNMISRWESKAGLETGIIDQQVLTTRQSGP